ncbi:MAG: tail fiber domain-containing protein, partial [Chitinivibrionales bacterium]|nr:tail fiber domain-containing protein [Chitinivibrionales bacterium]
MKGISYEFNHQNRKRLKARSAKQMGFSAQEIEKIFPEIVVTDSKGYKAINYTALI